VLAARDLDGGLPGCRSWHRSRFHRLPELRSDRLPRPPADNRHRRAPDPLAGRPGRRMALWAHAEPARSAAPDRALTGALSARARDDPLRGFPLPDLRADRAAPSAPRSGRSGGRTGRDDGAAAAKGAGIRSGDARKGQAAPVV